MRRLRAAAAAECCFHCSTARSTPRCVSAAAAVPLLLNEALCMRKRGALRDAEINLNEVLEADAACAKAWFRRGQVRVGLDKWELARADLARAAELDASVAADVRREPVVQGDLVPVGLPERDALRLARDALQDQGRVPLDASRDTVDNRKADGPRLVGHELAEPRRVDLGELVDLLPALGVGVVLALVPHEPLETILDPLLV